MITAACRLSHVPVLIAALACAGCSSCASSAQPPAEPETPVEQSAGSGSPAASTARILKKGELSEAEIRYGRAPRPDPSVTYQDDVVIVEGGADAIRAVSKEGLLWTIDARAPKAEDLAVGRIAFITDRCVGRVLHLTREGDDLKVLLGPVQLTEIFRTLDITLEDAPIDLNEVVPLPRAEFDGLADPIEEKVARHIGAADNGYGIRPASWNSPVQNAPVAPGIPQRLNPTFNTKTLDNARGVGVELAHGGSGIRAVAQVQLRLAQPTLDLGLHIRDDGVNGWLILKNAAALHVAFDAGTNEHFTANVKWTKSAGGFSLPIGGPVPLNVTVRQHITVETIFTAKQAFFTAGGDYDINGDFGFRFSHGHFMTVLPKGITVRNSLTKNMNTIAMGPMGLTLGHRLTLVVGVGILEFTVGPTFEISTRLGAGQGASIGMVQCQGASLSMWIRGGIGWTIPEFVTNFINEFFSIFRAAPLPAQGGSFTRWWPLFEQKYAQTDSRVCGGS